MNFFRILGVNVRFFIYYLLIISRTIIQKNFVQFEAMRFKWHHFENAKNAIFAKIAILKWLYLQNQMQFSDWHFEGIQKTFQIPVAKRILLQIWIFGLFF